MLGNSCYIYMTLSVSYVCLNTSAQIQLLWSWWVTSYKDSHNCVPGSQRVVLLKEVLDPLGGEALLKEVHHWGGLRGVTASSHFRCALPLPGFPAYRWKMKSASFLLLLPRLPFPQWTLTLETTASQNKLLHQLIMVLVFYHSSRKVTKLKRANGSTHTSTNKGANAFTQRNISQQRKEMDHK